MRGNTTLAKNRVSLGILRSGRPLLACLILLTAISGPNLCAQEREKQATPIEVKIGGYDFPPYVWMYGGQTAKGATLDLIVALNQSQSEYRFSFFPTTAKRRYLDFKQQNYDVILFESVLWGWQKLQHDATSVFMGGGEVYIALNLPGRDQNFFTDIQSKQLVGILGYHYGFASFNADEDFLRKNFAILLSNNHERNIQLVLLNRPDVAEVAVVTKSLLDNYLEKSPRVKNQLLISQVYDQTYEHRAIVRPGSPIAARQLEALINALGRSGAVERIRERWHLSNSIFESVH
ncbi:MAG: phosphate/phosphite/phosphonate ABC transporter substrate-binding protein [Pseudomonadales bacterium]|nr:transporter substrate-binding domain-containing protein [Oleiphilus messinensis]MCG8611741.1 phosphate/phosphite/phosphonate ABC transporter substrate-binding protein [Pseudomonadales bacterium]